MRNSMKKVSMKMSLVVVIIPEMMEGMKFFLLSFCIRIFE